MTPARDLVQADETTRPDWGGQSWPEVTLLQLPVERLLDDLFQSRGWRTAGPRSGYPRWHARCEHRPTSRL
jgi:hypothetical protein